MDIQSSLSRILKVFYSYAPEDRRLRDALEKHLSSLKRQGIITGWHDGEIRAGSEWETMLKKHLATSDLILLLISADFIASDYCYCIEMEQALERHERGEAHVIPILLRPADTHGLPFARLQFLPVDGKPITRQKNKDYAFAKIAETLRALIYEICGKLPSEPSPSGAGGSSLAWWKVPYPRNAFFTGRDSLLEQLYTAFRTGRTAIFVQALNGLGGIGKTQTALEYAYRYASTYQAIFWVAADPQGDLLADFVSIAQFLGLPEKDEPDQQLIVAAIKYWLQQHERWLVVFDNVEDITRVKPFLPPAGQGHILITTRAQATGSVAVPCEIEPMELQEGALFLLRRVKLLSPDQSLDQAGEREREAAREITRLFGGHPLALDQAGAYLEETGQSLLDYLALYRRRQAALLDRRGDASTDHPDSVMMTFALAFAGVERTRPDAAALLRFCAFLHPDALPEELLMRGALSFDPAFQGMARDPFELDAALAVLRRYSLIRRNPTTKTVSIHRLVQDVLRSNMEREGQRHWAEIAVSTLGREFPNGEPESWSLCGRYLPHARVCLQLIEEWQMRSVEAARLLDHVGHYLYRRAEYPEARLRYEQALAILAEEEEPLLTAQILSDLGILHLMLADYVQAEQYLTRALNMRKHTLEPSHPDTARSLNDLAGVYHNQGNYAQAEPLYREALAIQEQAPQEQGPALARTLNNLALLHYSQQQYSEAEALYARALAVREKSLGSQHADTAQSLLNLAHVYRLQQRYAEAEPLFTRALAIYEETAGPDHAYTGIALGGLGLLLVDQQRSAEAEPLLARALAIWEQTLGADHPRNVGALNALATIALHQGRYAEAEQWLRRAVQIQAKTSWLEYVDLVPNLRALARVYEDRHTYAEAAPLYELVLAICLRVQGEGHPEVAAAREAYASCLRRTGDAADESGEAG